MRCPRTGCGVSLIGEELDAGLCDSCVSDYVGEYNRPPPRPPAGWWRMPLAPPGSVPSAPVDSPLPRPALDRLDEAIAAVAAEVRHRPLGADAESM